VWRTWPRLLLWLQLWLLPWPGSAADCPRLWPDATFLQLYADDPPLTSERLRHWRALGAEELILQWSAYGPPDGGPFPLVESGRLAMLLDAAAEAGLRLRLGLRYDPGFWRERDAGEPEEPLQRSELARYLERRLADQAVLLAVLAPLTRHPAFAGWYLADEIDDRRWNARRPRLLLLDYLRRSAEPLRADAPQADLAVSGFSGGLVPPAEWAAFWVELLNAARIDRLLFQDGVGAGKLEPDELDYYLPVLAERLGAAGRALSVVVELFEADPERPDHFRPAPPARVSEQLSRAAGSGLPPATFALPHYADPAAGPAAAELAEALAALRRDCGG